MPKFPRIRGKERKIEPISEAEQEAIFAEIPAEHKPIFTLIRNTGCRLGEACKLKKTDIDRARGIIHFRETKTGKDREFPIMPDLEDGLKVTDLRSPYQFMWLDKPYDRRRLFNLWWKANRRAGCRMVRLYDLRASFICRMAPTMELGVLAKLVGQSIRTMDKHYLAYDAETMREAMEGKR